MNQQQSFENLEVFQRAYSLSLEIHHKSLKLPKIEQYGLAEQMRRSSKSICANIAEGYGKRSSKAEFNRYLKISIGSSDEMRVWLRYCLDLGYINEEEWHRWQEGYRAIAKMLNGLSRAVTDT
jgi:four helix bundle protein